MLSNSLTIVDPLAHGQIELREQVSFARDAVRRRLLLILLSLVLGGLAAVLFTATQERAYTATSSVQIEQRSAEVVAPDNLNPTPPSADLERQLNTQLDTLRSRAMAARVAQDLNLAADPLFYKAMNLDPASARAGAGTSQATLDAIAQMLSKTLR